MSDFMWPFRLSCWRIICSVSSFYPHLCKLLSRERMNIWPINRDENKTVQCGHVHSVALISKDVIHSTVVAVDTGCVETAENTLRRLSSWTQLNLYSLNSFSNKEMSETSTASVFWIMTSLSSSNTNSLSCHNLPVSSYFFNYWRGCLPPGITFIQQR